MKILLIDTCGATGSLALADTSLQPSIVASASLPGRSASERLVGSIRDLTTRSGIALASLDAIAIVHGPGSFTGVRVGLSAAKGLCEALNLPLVAISRLAVLANLAEVSASQVFTLLDAGRGEFYLGIYTGTVCVYEAMVTRTELLAAIAAAASTHTSPPELILCEPALARALAQSLAQSVPPSLQQLSPRLIPEPTAQDALPLALARLLAGEFSATATIDANYLRCTDAEIFAKSLAPSPASDPRPASTPRAASSTAEAVLPSSTPPR